MLVKVCYFQTFPTSHMVVYFAWYHLELHWLLLHAMQTVLTLGCQNVDVFQLKKKLLIVAHVAVTALTVNQLVYSAEDLIGQIL